MQQQGTLYHVSVAAPSLIFSNKATITRVAISLQDNSLHRLTINDSCHIEKEGTVPLPCSAVSLSFDYKDWIVVSLENGSIALSTWDSLFNYKEGPSVACKSRKRKLDGDPPLESDDIFQSLLSCGQSSGDGSSSWLTEVAHIPNPNEHTLLTSKLFGTNLGAFYVCNTKSNDDELCLSLWRQSGPTSSDTIVTFDSTPLAIVSHNHSKPLSTSPCTSPPPSVMVTCTSGSNHISECLYSYLFSHEDLILKSPVIIYGCICGCVLAVPFKRVQDHQPQVICSFNDHQSVVSIHTCTLGVGPSSIHNSLICIGSNGCVNIFVAHNSTVTHRQVFIAPQLISTILVHGLGLVYSSIDTVQKICMRHQCCSSVASTSTDDAVLRVFNTPLVLIQSPLVILCVDRGIMLGITMDGRLTYQHLHSQQTPCVGMTTNTSAAAVGESMKTSVLSLQTSADILRQLQHDISNIDDSLMALNETILLFRRLRTSDRSPLVLQAEVLYEQNGVDQHSPYLQITVTCIDSRPLRRGVALIIDVGCHDDTRMKVFMERRISKEDELCVFSQTFDLQGFQSGCGQLILKPKIPFHYYHSLRLNISFYCVYNPQNHGSLELELQSNLKNQLGIVKICQQKLSPLHFVSPVKSINNRSSAKTQISLNISLNSLNTVTGCTSTTDDPSKPMDSRLLSGLFTCSKMEEFIVQVYRGGRGLQVRMVCGIDLVMVQLHWNATQNHFVLTFDSSCKELAILLVNEITQRIVTQVSSISDHVSVIIHKNRQIQHSVLEMQEAFVKYFHDTII